MIRFLIACLLAAVASVALAATIDVTFSHPTQNTDGTPIPATGPGALASTRVQVGSCSGIAFGTMVQEKVVAHPGNQASFTNLAAGVYCVRAYAKNNLGMESSESATVVSGPTPKAGAIVTVVIGP